LKKKTLTMADVAGEPFVLLDEMHCLGEQILTFCRNHECLPAVSCKAAQMQTVQAMVGQGQGVSLVPEMAAKSDQTSQRVYRSLGASAPRRTLAMIRHRDRDHRQLVTQLAELIRGQRVTAG
jgi:LysR family hydrogen peroxide-inducible transcriptional activator